MSNRRLLACWVLVGALLLLGVGSHVGFSRAADKEEPKGAKPAFNKHPDFLALKKIYADNAVVLETEDGKVILENVRIIGVDELFGKAFLRLESKRGNAILTRADRVATIRVVE